MAFISIRIRSYLKPLAQFQVETLFVAQIPCPKDGWWLETPLKHPHQASKFEGDAPL